MPLPSNSSQFTQLLDVGVFSPLDKYVEHGIYEHVGYTHQAITKREFNNIYNKARCQAFTTHNIKQAWKRTGLVPLNKQHLLNQLLAVFTQLATPPLSDPLTPQKEHVRTPKTIRQHSAILKALSNNTLTPTKRAIAIAKATEAHSKAVLSKRLSEEAHSELLKEQHRYKKRYSANMALGIDGSAIHSHAIVDEALKEQEERQQQRINAQSEYEGLTAAERRSAIARKAAATRRRRREEGLVPDS